MSYELMSLILQVLQLAVEIAVLIAALRT